MVIAVKKKELPLKLGIFRQVNDVFLFLKTAYAAWRNVYVNVNSGYLLGEVFIYVSFKLRGIFAYFFYFFNEHIIKKQNRYFHFNNRFPNRTNPPSKIGP